MGAGASRRIFPRLHPPLLFKERASSVISAVPDVFDLLSCPQTLTTGRSGDASCHDRRCRLSSLISFARIFVRLGSGWFDRHLRCAPTAPGRVRKESRRGAEATAAVMFDKSAVSLSILSSKYCGDTDAIHLPRRRRKPQLDVVPGRLSRSETSTTDRTSRPKLS